jgi:hypothetical protein
MVDRGAVGKMYRRVGVEAYRRIGVIRFAQPVLHFSQKTPEFLPPQNSMAQSMVCSSR